MKTKSILSALSLIATVTFNAQDVLTFNNGKSLEVKIVEITPTSVTYKKFENISGPSYIVLQIDVYKIKYENGIEEVFDSNATSIKTESVTSTTQKRIKFNGPRVGCTFIGEGLAADYLLSRGKQPFVSQFGWQFENRIFTSKNGISGISEFVPLVGGMEQGMFLPSLSFLFGIRGANGNELAVGPNLSLTGISMVFAAGTSFHIDDIYFPVNLVFVPSVIRSGGLESGFRISLLIGFNVRKS